MKAQIQGDELRVSSKSRDDLQKVQALVKAADSTSPCSSPTIGNIAGEACAPARHHGDTALG